MRYCTTSGCHQLVDHGRCARHQQTEDAVQNARTPWLRDPVYRRNRATVLAHASVCAICGGPATPTDPMTADHVVPAQRFVERGEPVDNTVANLRPAHLSCNSSRQDREPVKVESMADVYGPRPRRRR